MHAMMIGRFGRRRRPGWLTRLLAAWRRRPPEPTPRWREIAEGLAVRGMTRDERAVPRRHVRELRARPWLKRRSR